MYVATGAFQYLKSSKAISTYLEGTKIHSSGLSKHTTMYTDGKHSPAAFPAVIDAHSAHAQSELEDVKPPHSTWHPEAPQKSHNTISHLVLQCRKTHEEFANP